MTLKKNDFSMSCLSLKGEGKNKEGQENKYIQNQGIKMANVQTHFEFQVFIQ
jgi:hypothetical protein